MDMVCKIGHKSLFLKLSTNFVSVQDNPSETSVSSFQISTSSQLYVSISIGMYLKETIQKFGFMNTILKLQHNMKKYTKCNHYKFHLLFVTVINSIVVNILINVTNLKNVIFTTFLLSSRCAKSTKILSASEILAQKNA